jgi:hypothetical protein
MDMEELLQRIIDACAAYYLEELDDAGFQKVVNEIPEKVWQDKDAALAIVKELVENEDLYEVSLKKRELFAEFVCSLLPQSVREKPDYILGIAEIIAEFMGTFDEGLSSGDLKKVFSSMPHTPWEDEAFAIAAANMVIDRAYAMYDMNCISEVIPESVWQNEDELVWVVRRLYNEDERNMAHLSLFPRKSWESKKVIFEILSCLQSALENDRAWGTVYCNFRGDNESYFDGFLYYLPDKFKSDKDFILELLGYEYFFDGFSQVYDWIDQNLWLDKDFVLKVLEMDTSAVMKVPDQLAADEEFRVYVEENIDLEDIVQSVSEEKLPQWIKDWNK